MQSVQSSRYHHHPHQNIFASQISDPRRSILPTFEDDNEPSSPIPSAYTLDFDFSDLSSHFFPSPQLETFLTGSYLDDFGINSADNNTTANPNTRGEHEKSTSQVPIADMKLRSFAELEEDCSALQFDSEVIVLTRTRVPSTLTQGPPQAGPSTSRAPTPPAKPSVVPPAQTQTQSGPSRKESKYQRNAPPHLHLKGSNHDSRRQSSRRGSSRRRDTRSSNSLPNDLTSPAGSSLNQPQMPEPPPLLLPTSPKSGKAWRVSYASSKSSKRGGASSSSRILFSTKELHRRRILKLQRTFGEQVPLELVAVSPARRRRRGTTSKRISVVSYRGPRPDAESPAAASPVRDWSLDSISPVVKPKSSCSIFGFSGVGDASKKAGQQKQKQNQNQNSRRKSRAISRSGKGGMKPREEEVEVIEHDHDHEGAVDEDDLDRRENSIWLDEDPPVVIGRRIQARPSSPLVFASMEPANVPVIPSATETYFEGQQHPHPHPHPAPRSEVDVLSLAPPPRPFSEVTSSDETTSSFVSPRSSFPVFYHGSDSDHTNLQHSQYFLHRQSSNQHPQQQQQHRQRQPLPPIPAMSTSPAPSEADNFSPALFWPRMPFSGPPNEQAAGTVTVGSALEAYGQSLFMDEPESALATRRSERRQGWSGEWNQPSFRDVLQRLRDM